MPTSLRVAAVQIGPVLLDRARTLDKVLAWTERAAERGARVAVFPEALLPGYPAWLARTGGARFDDPLQKELHARYLDQAVELPGPELARLLDAARDLGTSSVLGVVERGRAASRGSLWCTALWVHPDGRWLAHRKLVPTYEERLAWTGGDGHGLVVQDVDGWRVGALNCWENWMPQARFALYAQGEEVHLSLWPGSPALTTDAARFAALEGRVYSVAAAGVARADELAADLPARDALAAGAVGGFLHTGGSRVVAPDGELVAAADDPEETVLVAELDRGRLLGERQNLDPAGHYHRSDVFRVRVDRTRREPAAFDDGPPDLQSPNE